MAERIVHLGWSGAEGDLRVRDGGRLERAADGLRLRLTGAGPALLWARDPALLSLADGGAAPVGPYAVAPLALVTSGVDERPRQALMPDGRRADLSDLAEGMACFAPGTWIATPSGARAVETLVPGDTVLTRDNGVRPVVWRGETFVDPWTFGALPHMAPVQVPVGALGPGQPEQALTLSPNHRVLVAENASALHFEEREVLVAARDLCPLRRAQRWGPSALRWQHVLLDSHEIILANGAWCETLQPVPGRLSGFAPEVQMQIKAAAEHGRPTNYDAARLMLTRSEAALLAVAS